MGRATGPVFVRAMALARSAVNGRGCTTTGERACSPGSPETEIASGFSAYYYHLVHAPFCKEEIHD